MYSFSYLEPVCCSMSHSNCCFLTCIQISQGAGQVVTYSHFFQNFSQFVAIHIFKLEKEMATHSSVLAWRIPGTGAWWATIYGVAQSRTQLTWLSSSIVKGFGIVNKAEEDIFLELSCFFDDDPGDVGNLISGSSGFSKSSLNIWKFLVHILLKPG